MHQEFDYTMSINWNVRSIKGLQKQEIHFVYNEAMLHIGNIIRSAVSANSSSIVISTYRMNEATNDGNSTARNFRFKEISLNQHESLI